MPELSVAKIVDDMTAKVLALRGENRITIPKEVIEEYRKSGWEVAGFKLQVVLKDNEDCLLLTPIYGNKIMKF